METRSISRIPLISLVLCLSVLLQAADAAEYDGREQLQANQFVESQLLHDANFAFNLPKSAQLDIGRVRAGDVVFDYFSSTDESIGLRLWIASNDIDDRYELTRRLKAEKFLEDGDVILTFHPEWSDTGPYPSMMAGISHAGMVFEQNGGMRNIDMPLNEDQNLDLRHNGRAVPSYLSSDHYVNHTEFIHVLRPRNFNARQRRHLNDWAELFAARTRGASRNPVYGHGNHQTSFNGNYLSPAYAAMSDPGAPLGSHSLDLARAVTGDKLEYRYVKVDGSDIQYRYNLPLFCSDFVWSLHALRNCRPNRFDDDTCQPEPLFAPLSFVGEVGGDLGNFDGYRPGLTDAPFLMLASMDPVSDEIDNHIDRIIRGRKGLTNISSGHRKAAGLIPDDLYASIADYWRTFLQARRKLAAEDPATRQEGQALMQEAQLAAQNINFLNIPAERRPEEMRDLPYVPKNYSPTTYLINAMLPNSNNNKVFDYVGTIALLDRAQYSALIRRLDK
jgi:hypothetical protein